MTAARGYEVEPPRRGLAALTVIVLILIAQLAIIGFVLAGARDQDLTVLRRDSVQSFYAAEAGANMGIRELMVNYDEDGDGTVGSISDDGTAANDPTLGGAAFVVARVDGATNATLTATARANITRRLVTADVTLEGSGIPFEHAEITAVDNNVQTIVLKKRYDDPVVVCTMNYYNNSRPMVVRVDNVTATSFDLWLQNPGDVYIPSAERVWYLVMEAGSYDIDGVKFEAQSYTSTVTDRDSSWGAEAQSYLQTYTTPVVLGQVMSANDPDWSVFWCRGTAPTSPPTATTVRTGKMLAEDTDTTRSNETVGFVVFEAGGGTIGGVAMDARISSDSIAGVDNAPPYAAPFNAAFGAPPAVVLCNLGGMDGSNGGWLVVHGATPATTIQANVVVDEDQIKDSERSHTTEQGLVLAFEEAGITPDIVGWAEAAPP